MLNDSLFNIVWWIIFIYYSDQSEAAIRVLIVVPTNELCEQVASVLRSLLYYCTDTVSLLHMTSDKTMSLQSQIPQLREKPGMNDVVGVNILILYHYYI